MSAWRRVGTWVPRRRLPRDRAADAARAASLAAADAALLQRDQLSGQLEQLRALSAQQQRQLQELALRPPAAATGGLAQLEEQLRVALDDAAGARAAAAEAQRGVELAKGEQRQLKGALTEARWRVTDLTSQLEAVKAAFDQARQAFDQQLADVRRWYGRQVRRGAPACCACCEPRGRPWAGRGRTRGGWAWTVAGKGGGGGGGTARRLLDWAGARSRPCSLPCIHRSAALWRRSADAGVRRPQAHARPRRAPRAGRSRGSQQARAARHDDTTDGPDRAGPAWNRAAGMTGRQGSRGRLFALGRAGRSAGAPRESGG